MANAIMVEKDSSKIDSFAEFRVALGQGLGRRIVSLLFVLGIVPLSVLTLIFVLFYIQAQVQGIQTVQKELAEGIAAEITAYLAKTEGQIRLFARLLDLESQGGSDLKPLADDLLDQGHEYDAITIANIDGNEICKVSRYYSFRDFELGSIAPQASFQYPQESRDLL